MKIEKFLKVLSNETRLRILMLLSRRRLSVCQIMGVLGVSQPLISKSLYMLEEAGILTEERKGKFIFYSLRKDLPVHLKGIISILKRHASQDKRFLDDMKMLAECMEFQKKIGKCDMETYRAFIAMKKKKNLKSGHEKRSSE